MRIITSRSWLPWGRPSVKVDMSKDPGHIIISGAKHKSVTISFDKLNANMKVWAMMEQNYISTKQL